MKPGAMLATFVLAGAIGTAVGAPPQMPPVFDRPTVSGLLKNVDQDENAAVLKFGYFARRSRQALPEAEGLAMVRVALRSTPAGSRKWFVLQSVLGFGCFRAGPTTQMDAYHAYDLLFDSVGKAQAAHCADVVAQAIYEAVATVIGNFGAGSGQVAGDGPCLSKAVQAEISLLKAGYASRYPVPWRLAMKAVGGPGDIRDIVDRALADPAMPRSYGLYMLAAAVLSTSDAARAAALLQQAKALATSPLERQQVQRDMVQQFVANKNLPDAIVLQENWVQSTGTGYADLIRLLWARKDTAGVDAQITALERAGTSEAEINSAAAVLAALGRESASSRPLEDRAVALLTSYLGAPRKRSVQQELWARLTLADLYLSQRRLDDARADIEKGLALSPALSQVRALAQRSSGSTGGSKATGPRGARTSSRSTCVHLC
jgi:tetratricopeptide (TPR) repeat protein